MSETWLYCITCRSSGKLYVGITTRSPDARWKTHCYNASRGVDTRFYNAVRKYGALDFDVFPLHLYPTQEAAAQAEIDCIAGLDLIERGYNSSLGGHLGQLVGHKRSGTALEGLRRGAATRAADPMWRAKMREVAFKRAQNPDYRMKLSAALTGKSHSVETRNLIRAKRKNQITSEATRAKMSASQQRRRAEELRAAAS